MRRFIDRARDSSFIVATFQVVSCDSSDAESGRAGVSAHKKKAMEWLPAATKAVALVPPLKTSASPQSDSAGTAHRSAGTSSQLSKNVSGSLPAAAPRNAERSTRRWRARHRDDGADVFERNSMYNGWRIEDVWLYR